MFPKPARVGEVIEITILTLLEGFASGKISVLQSSLGGRR